MKRKIALISQYASPFAEPGQAGSRAGGIDAAQAACALAWMGIQVDLFACETDPELPEIYEWRENVRIIQVPAAAQAGQADLIHTFREYMQDLFSRQGHTPDLIHAANLQSGWVAAELKTRSGIPFVVTYDAPTGMLPGESFGLDQRVIRLADGIIVSSAREKEDLLRGYCADPTYIVEIPPGEIYDGQPEDAWQSVVRRLAALYEDVLAIRRVTIPGMRVPVLTAGTLEYQNAPAVAQPAFEAALYFYNEAGMLNLPAGSIE